jgi:hypothetical protein
MKELEKLWHYIKIIIIFRDFLPPEEPPGLTG